MMRGEQKDERTRALGDRAFTRRKNRWKILRTILEVIVVGSIALSLYRLFFVHQEYHPYDASLLSFESEHTGFIALSYFGVDRNGDTSTRIGHAQLRKHLQALKEQGYVTITQKDIEDYYLHGKPLPRWSLYLMFEDGRRDTAILAQDVLEELNYKATMMTYASNLLTHDLKFLQPNELLELRDSSFWELGTNGFRLEYINVFDLYGNYLGELDPLRYAQLQPYLGRNYNHYLMDYIRDRHHVPRESYNHMKSRISYDYRRMKELYEEHLGTLPQAHILMHSNTGRFGNNRDVSAVNESWIRELFPMNFNREGYCLNLRNSSIYDLTRMQPQPYWPINHLLMRIKYDIDQPIEFLPGDVKRQEGLKLLEGAAELEEETYILTSLPTGRGLARIDNTEELKDVGLSVRLRGNAFGAQQIFLRSSKDLASSICVELVNDQLLVLESGNGQKKELYREKIPVLLGERILSVEEHRKETEVQENLTFSRYAESEGQIREYMARAKARQDQPAATVEEGAAPYEGPQSFHARGDHELELELRGEVLALRLDGTPVEKEIHVGLLSPGSVYLGASWEGEAWSQRNLSDDVYDGVFESLVLSSYEGAEDKEGTVVFSTELAGWDKFVYTAGGIFETVLTWFMNHL